MDRSLPSFVRYVVVWIWCIIRAASVAGRAASVPYMCISRNRSRCMRHGWSDISVNGE